MNATGLSLCARFGYPPNSLSLCGPEQQHNLSWYAENLKPDQGTTEILQQFSTLYPYLQLIAGANNIQDPFDPRVVEAYWIGNSLLNTISVRSLEIHLTDTLLLKRKLNIKRLTPILSKLDHHPLPHHSFHVLNIYHRTGHVEEDHTIQSMDACIIQWGTVVKKLSTSLVVKTSPLTSKDTVLEFGKSMLREIFPVGENDKIFTSIKLNDIVSYHWGYLCQKLNKRQLMNLQYYTKLSIDLANIT